MSPMVQIVIMASYGYLIYLIRKNNMKVADFTSENQAETKAQNDLITKIETGVTKLIADQGTGGGTVDITKIDFPELDNELAANKQVTQTLTNLEAQVNPPAAP